MRKEGNKSTKLGTTPMFTTFLSTTRRPNVKSEERGGRYCAQEKGSSVKATCTVLHKYETKGETRRGKGLSVERRLTIKGNTSKGGGMKEIVH